MTSLNTTTVSATSEWSDQKSKATIRAGFLIRLLETARVFRICAADTSRRNGACDISGSADLTGSGGEGRAQLLMNSGNAPPNCTLTAFAVRPRSPAYETPRVLSRQRLRVDSSFWFRQRFDAWGELTMTIRDENGASRDVS